MYTLPAEKSAAAAFAQEHRIASVGMLPLLEIGLKGAAGGGIQRNVASFSPLPPVDAFRGLCSRRYPIGSPRSAGAHAAVTQQGSNAASDRTHCRLVAMVCADPTRGGGRWNVRLIAPSSVLFLALPAEPPRFSSFQIAHHS